MPARGLAFLSHWSGDAATVRALAAQLDHASAFIDIRSMVPGVNNLEQMKAAVGSASVFVFVVSPQTPKECFSFYEATQAEFEKASRVDLEILAWPINGASYRDAPEWMQRYFAVSPEYSISDVAREVRSKALSSLIKAGLAAAPVYEGRETLQRKISFDYKSQVSTTGKPISALVLTGLPGMGRASIARHLPPHVYPALKTIFPEFDLPESADALDLYLNLFADIEGNLAIDRISALTSSFPIEPQDQAKLIALCLKHWGEINQPVIIKMRWGLRERAHSLRPWFEFLLRELQGLPKVRVIFITSRRFEPATISAHGNIQQHDVPALDIDTSAFLLTKLTEIENFNPAWFRQLAELSSGQPATLHHVAYLINKGRSPDTLLAKPELIFAFQDRVLETIYADGGLTDTEKELLWVLCWFPGIDFVVLKRVFSQLTASQLAETLWTLSDYFLIEQTQNGAYRLPTVVRSTFSRRITRVSATLQPKVINELQKLIESPSLSPHQLQPIILAFASSNSEIPAPLRSAFTPGVLSSVIEIHYEKARMTGERAELERSYSLVTKLAELSLSMKVPADTLENILVLGGDSLVRLGQDPETLVKEMLKRGFIAGHYVRASYLFHRRRDSEAAILELNKVIGGRAFRRRSIRLLTRILLRLGRGARALDALDMLSESEILKDSGFLTMKIRALRSQRRGKEAEELEKKLKTLGDDFGDVLIFEATKSLRANDYFRARTLVEEAFKKPKANRVTLKFLLCLIDLKDKNVESLAEACSLADAIGRTDDANQLRARAALLVDEDWKTAETELQKIEHRGWFDCQLELQILAQKALDETIKRDSGALVAIEARRAEVLRQISSAVDYG